jgi:hypothetical protein
VAKEGLSALEEQLGARPPAGLRKLDDAHLTDLAEAVRDARRRQAAELKAAGDQAFRHIPRLLRGPIRRILS